MGRECFFETTCGEHVSRFSQKNISEKNMLSRASVGRMSRQSKCFMTFMVNSRQTSAYASTRFKHFLLSRLSGGRAACAYCSELPLGGWQYLLLVVGPDQDEIRSRSLSWVVVSFSARSSAVSLLTSMMGVNQHFIKGFKATTRLWSKTPVVLRSKTIPDWRRPSTKQHSRYPMPRYN